MSDYISREALLNAVLELPPKMDEDGYGWLGRRGVWQMVADFPAADVREVKRGKWFLDGDYEYINCSECLYPFYMGFDTSSDARQYLASEERWKYCPNCGARMDGDGE